MSKITFRADADLVDRLEECEASKSEVMREALRGYLDDAERSADAGGTDPSGGDTDAEGGGSALDDALAARVDELVTARLDEAPDPRRGRGAGRPFGAPAAAPEVSLTVNVDGRDVDVGGEEPSDTASTVEPSSDATAPDASTRDAASETDATACAQCGEGVSADHVYCPNCGEKATRRLFCECGDELRSDWGFCPGCGRRTPAADVLDGP